MLQSKSLIKIRQWWVKIQNRCSDRLAKYVKARGPFAEIVEAVYDCRSSGLSSGFGYTNNSHSGKANEDVGGPAELGIPPQIDKMSIFMPDPFDSNSCLTPLIKAQGPFAGIVEAVYDCRSSGLSSGFGCRNNSHSGKANEDVGAPTELGYPSSN
jgi:hypothetical protein